MCVRMASLGTEISRNPKVPDLRVEAVSCEVQMKSPTQVAYLDGVVHSEEDVLRFDVSVKNLLVVNELQCQANLWTRAFKTSAV